MLRSPSFRAFGLNSGLRWLQQPKRTAAWCFVGTGWLALACTTGCNRSEWNFGGQTGDGSDGFQPDPPINEGEDPPEHWASKPAGGNCPEAPPEPVPTLDSDLEGLDFTAEDLLDAALTERSSSLSWAPSGELSTSPETGQGSISIRLEYSGGDVRLFQPSSPEEDAEAVQQDHADAGIGGPPAALSGPVRSSCSSRLEVDVVAHLMTPGGALMESVAVTLSATSIRWIDYAGAFEAPALNGTLQLQSPEGRLPNSFTLRGQVSPFGTAGDLSASWAVEDSEANESAPLGAPSGLGTEVRARQRLVAIWPSLTECPGDRNAGSNWIAATDQSVLQELGFGSALEAAMALPGNLPLSWKDGSETELTLGLKELAQPCLRHAYAQTIVRYGGELTAQTQDMRLDGSYDAMASVSFLPLAELARVSLSANATLEGRAADLAGPDVAELTGLQSLSAADHGDQETLQFSLYLDYGNQEPSGQISLYGSSRCEEPQGLCQFGEQIESAEVGEAIKESSPRPELEMTELE